MAIDGLVGVPSAPSGAVDPDPRCPDGLAALPGKNHPAQDKADQRGVARGNGRAIGRRCSARKCILVPPRGPAEPEAAAQRRRSAQKGCDQ